MSETNYMYNIPNIPADQTGGQAGGNVNYQYNIPFLPSGGGASYGPANQTAGNVLGNVATNVVSNVATDALSNVATNVIGNVAGKGLGAGIAGALGSVATPLGIGLSLASSVIGFRKARKAERAAKRRAKKAEAERKRQEEAYRNLDTSNPYLNLENTMEDLTINQKQSQFEKQQFQQGQANILDSLRGSAGSGGVAALAQTLARENQLASQRSAADIGRQEAANQRAEREMAGQIQSAEREGEVYSRNLERSKTETLFGMAQQRAAASKKAVADAKAAKMQAITGGLMGAANMFAGFGAQPGTSDETT